MPDDVFKRKGPLHPKKTMFYAVRHRDFDWHRFWLIEVVILAVPVLVTVLATGGRAPISSAVVAVLLIALVTLTVMNLFLGLSRQSGGTRR